MYIYTSLAPSVRSLPLPFLPPPFSLAELQARLIDNRGGTDGTDLDDPFQVPLCPRAQARTDFRRRRARAQCRTGPLVDGPQTRSLSYVSSLTFPSYGPPDRPSADALLTREFALCFWVGSSDLLPRRQIARKAA